MTGMAIGAAMVSSALAVDHFSATAAGRQSIVQALMAMKLRHEVPDEAYEKMVIAKAKADEKTHKGDEGHHTIPMYLCGHPDQQLSLVTFAQHVTLHAGLSAVLLFIEKSMEETETSVGVPLARRRQNAIVALGGTIGGREAIANAIGGLYDAAGAFEWGTPSIGVVFPRERRYFVGGHTSCAPTR